MRTTSGPSDVTPSAKGGRKDGGELSRMSYPITMRLLPPASPFEHQAGEGRADIADEVLVEFTDQTAHRHKP